MTKKDMAKIITDIELSSLRALAPNATKRNRRLFANRIVARLYVMGALSDKPLKKLSSS